MNKENRGRSAYDRSSQMRVGSLSRIGLRLKNKEPYKRNTNAPDNIRSILYFTQIGGLLWLTSY